MCYSSNGGVFRPLVLLGIILFHFQSSLFQLGFCFNLSYPSFPRNVSTDFQFSGESYIVKDAIQVTADVRGGSISNISGRALYSKPFRLWNKKSRKTASFNSTFVINITPQTDPTGEGLAFVLAADNGIPANSYGEWLGITNSTANGSAVNRIVAVEFDTKKSYPEDIDDNHVGLDVNSVYSTLQVPLRHVNLSSGTDVTAVVRYDGELKTINVSVFKTGNNNGSSGQMGNASSPVISASLDLTRYLPETVLVGFAASTGDSTELNCIRAWDFTGEDIEGNESKKLLWLWITIPVTLLILLGGLTGWCYFYRKRRFPPFLGEEAGEEENQNEDPMLELEIQSSSRTPRKFRLKELKSATGDFSPKNELGRGGFGTVYRGLLNSSRTVAVKRFSKRSEHGKADFVAEVKTIGNLHHKNLVKLLGWCHENNELLLVYEFMPNGSLDHFIFPRKDSDPDPNLDWDTRHSVIRGVASALDYLHNGCEKRVLHRDIKASNILLDSDFNARLGDFGLARTIQFSDQTHHSTKEIAGTPGYMAPESFHTGRATAETDVYALGVLLLEVACGRKPGFQHELNHFSNGIVDWVWESYRRESILEVVDFRLKGEFREEEVGGVLVLGLACCHPNPYQRPSVRTALQVLTGEAPPPPVPTEKPAFMWPASMPPSFDYAVEDTPDHTGGHFTLSTVLSAR